MRHMTYIPNVYWLDFFSLMTILQRHNLDKGDRDRMVVGLKIPMQSVPITTPRLLVRIPLKQGAFRYNNI